MARRKGTQSCLLIGSGCLIAFAVVAVLIGGLMFYGFRKSRELEKTMNDPEARTSQALELLAADSLPEGYYAVTAFSIPFLMETVMLSDREPEGGDVESAFHQGDYSLLYTRMRVFGDKKEQLEELFEEGADPSGFQDRIPVRFQSREALAAGSADERGRRLRWATYRGSLGDHGGRDSADGIFSTIVIDCPEPRGRWRMAFWFGPDPDPQAAASEIDLTSSVGDGDRIQALLSGFDVCSR